MSIRRKLILSNILSFIVPLLVSILAVFLAIGAINNKFTASYYSVYYDNVHAIENLVKEENPDQAVSLAKELEDRGSYISLVLDGRLVYETEGYQEGLLEITGAASQDLIIEDYRETYMIKNEFGELNSIKLSEDQEDYIFILRREAYSLEEENRLMADETAYIIRLVVLVILAILAALILTSILATYVTINSILKPLSLLKNGSREIGEGNLEFSLDYEGDREFEEIFNDFESMRLKLLESRNKEEEYARDRKELIASITHDLNTPLTSIRGYTSGLLEGIADTRDKQVYYLQKINSVSLEMSQLINQLFLYSTLDMDKVKFKFERVDLIEYFKDCSLDLGEEFRQRDMAISFETDLEEAYANIDYIHFKRVVLNLLNNSYKYRGDGPGKLDIRLEESDLFYDISFKDQGLGVSKDQLDSIFEVFYRADKARSKDGYGLGLAIARNIVRAHGGRIGVNQNYNEGLEIIISLPKIRGD